MLEPRVVPGCLHSLCQYCAYLDEAVSYFSFYCMYLQPVCVLRSFCPFLIRQLLSCKETPAPLFAPWTCTNTQTACQEEEPEELFSSGHRVFSFLPIAAALPLLLLPELRFQMLLKARTVHGPVSPTQANVES